MRADNCDEQVLRSITEKLKCKNKIVEGKELAMCKYLLDDKIKKNTMPNESTSTHISDVSNRCLDRNRNKLNNSLQLQLPISNGNIVKGIDLAQQDLKKSILHTRGIAEFRSCSYENLVEIILPHTSHDREDNNYDCDFLFPLSNKEAKYNEIMHIASMETTDEYSSGIKFLDIRHFNNFMRNNVPLAEEHKFSCITLDKLGHADKETDNAEIHSLICTVSSDLIDHRVIESTKNVLHTSHYGTDHYHNDILTKFDKSSAEINSFDNERYSLNISTLSIEKPEETTLDASIQTTCSQSTRHKVVKKIFRKFLLIRRKARSKC